MRQTKSCACLIGAAARDLEISKRKSMLRIEEINKKLKTSKDTKKIIKLKDKKREIMKAIKETTKHKMNVKKLFDEHIKKSGYVPPKYKGR
ncbi:MAG: hypothetical protein IH934_01095 [Nanoarchaeota archaeon]|nr:hypothetical protein [Nanoarchaeota archaeon]